MDCTKESEISINERYKVKYFYRDEIHEFIKRSDFRIPTEAQWEYAGRGGTNTVFYFGGFFDYGLHLPYVLLNDYSDIQECEKYSNEFGLIGVSSVAEWCLDNWRDDYNAKLSGSEPFRDDSDVYVIRGGAAESWPWQSELEWVYAVISYRSTSISAPKPIFAWRPLIPFIKLIKLA